MFATLLGIEIHVEANKILLHTFKKEYKPSFKNTEGSPGEPNEGAGGEEETFVFSLFSRSSWKLRSGSFSASLERQPRDWFRFWGCLCKVGFLLQCIQSEVLHIWTGTVNTDANTVWGARKCLLIICGGKKIYFVYLLYQRGVWGRTVVFFFISCEKKCYRSAHFCVYCCVCVFLDLAFCSYWLAIHGFDG